MRRFAPSALVVLSSLLLIAAALMAYSRRVLFDSDQFANRAAATLHDARVRTLVADEVTDRLVLARQSDLLAARPIISSAVAGVVGGDAFGSLFRRSVLDVHRAVFSHDQDTLTLTIADAGTVAAEALRVVRPELADQLEGDHEVVLVRRRLGSVTGDLARVADDARILAYVFALLALAAGVAAIALSRDRRHTVSRLGVGTALAGVAIVIGCIVGRAIALGLVQDPENRAAAGAVWDAFLGDLRTLGWVLAGAGAVIAAAAASVIHPIEIEGRLRTAWQIATTDPDRTGLRVVRGGALIVAGVLVVADPMATVRVVATLVGVYLLYAGAEVLLRLVYRPPPPDAEVTQRRGLRRIVVPAIAALVIAGAFAAFYAGGGVTAPAVAVSGCNGHDELCDRRLDEVVLPATHNSMSAPLPGWFAALQERSIGGQLEDGIRGLLFDTHYADRLANGRIRTYFSSDEDIIRTAAQDGVSQQSIDAAMRLRERLGFRGSGERGMYLCHTFCELGATPLSDGLDDIHDFLVTHPSDVVVIVNQDYVTPADFVAAMGDAGLTKYAFRLGEEPWPTLRTMIERDQRLVVMAENRAGAAPWYQLAYERLLQETPFTFTKPAQLTDPATLAATCRPNRGPSTAPLFLINHWINTDPAPRPSHAEIVNAYGPLLRRATTCREIRDRIPNLLAVDFYKRGDLFRVVDTLNGVQ